MIECTMMHFFYANLAYEFHVCLNKYLLDHTFLLVMAYTFSLLLPVQALLALVWSAHCEWS